MVTRALAATGILGVLIGAMLSVWPTGTAVAATGINPEINFQGKVVNTDGTNVTDGTYQFQFKIYNVSSGGTALWTETKNLSVAAGIFETDLGDTTSLSGIDFNSNPLYLSMNFNPGSGYDGEMSPRILLTAAPYAFNSEELGGLTADQFGQLQIGTPAAQTGTLDVSGNLIAATSVQAPLVDTATAAALNIGTATATSVTIGRTSTQFTIQGNASSDFTSTDSGHTTTVGFVTPTGTNLIQFPNAGGTLCTTVASTCNTTYAPYSSTGYLNKNATDTSSAVISASNYLYGFTNSNTTPAAGGVLDLSNGANTGNTLYVTASGNPAASTNALVVVNNTAGAPSGNLVDLQKNGANELTVDYNGNVSQNGGSSTTDTFNGQTVSAAASFTGTVTAATSLLAPLVDTASAGTLAVGSTNATAISVGKTTSNIATTINGTALVKPTSGHDSTTAFAVQNASASNSVLTVDTTNNDVLLGTASALSGNLTFASAANGNTVSLGIISTGETLGNASIAIPNTFGTNDTVCLYNLGNCVGAGGSVTASGGTQYYVTKFTNLGGTQLGNSDLYDNGFVGDNTTTNSGQLSVVSNGATQPGLFVQSAASASAPTTIVQEGSSQSGDMIDMRDSSGGNLVSFGSAGNEESLGYFDNGAGGIGQYGNLLTNSELLNSGAWTTTGSPTVTNNFTTAPDGNTTAGKIVGSGSTSLTQTYTTSTTGTYTFSIWLKQVSGAGTTGLCIFTTGGTPSSCTATAVTPSSTDWQRFSVTTAVSGSPSNVKVEILPGNGSTATIYAWGAQLVLASTPEVYVRTTSTNVAATSGVVSNDLLTGNSGANIVGATNINTSGGGTTTVGSSAGGALSIQGGTAGTTINDTSGSLAVSTTTSGTLTVSSAGQLSLAGNGSTQLSATTGGNTTTLNFASVGGNATVQIPNETGTLCTNAVGGTCTTAGAGFIFNQSSPPGAAQMGNFNITGTGIAATALQAPVVDTATAVALAIGGTNATSVTIGKTTTPFTIQGNASSTLTSTDSGHTTTVGFVTPTGTNAINFPNAGGTLCTTTASTCNTTYEPYSSTGYLAKNATDTSSFAVTAANYLYGFTNSNATPTTGGVLDLSNSANTGNTLYVTASGNPASSTNALVVVNNTAGSPSGNLVDLQKAGANEFSVDYNGNVTQNGGTSTTDTINGQTISAAASFTGTVTAATSLLAPLVDTASAGTLSVGTGTANAITIGKSGVTTTLPGALQENNTEDINTNSTTAFNVEQNGVKNNVLTVDTTNGLVGIDQTPSATNAAVLQATGAISASTDLLGTNRVVLNSTSVNNGRLDHGVTAGTGGFNANDVIVIDNTGKAIQTTTARDPRVYGIAESTQTSGNTGNAAIGGNWTVHADATLNGAISIGDQLVTSTHAGYVMPDDNATTGILGIAEAALASGTGSISIEIRPVGGVTNPNIPGNLTVQGSGGVTVGTTANNAIIKLLDGTADGYTGTVELQGALPGNATYQLPNLAGTQTICTTNATSCSSTYAAAGSYLLQNPVANDASTSNFAGYQYSFTQSNTGAAGNLSLTNAGTGDALSVSASSNPSPSTNALVVINNTNGTPSGNLLDLQKAGANEFSVDYNGNVTQNGGTSTTDTINGQTISATASFTGTVTAATSFLAPLVDTATAGTLSIGTGTANAITIGSSTAKTTIPYSAIVGTNTGTTLTVGINTTPNAKLNVNTGSAVAFRSYEASTYDVGQFAETGTGVGNVNTNGTTTVSGGSASPLFTQYFRVGDAILVNGQLRTVSAIASDTSITVSSSITTGTNQAYYNGVVGAGTVTTNGTTTLAGSSTTFQSTFQVGDTILINGETNPNTVAAIASNTSLTLATAAATSASGLAYARSGYDRLNIKANGNVGIGTNSSTAALMIQPTGVAQTGLVIQGADGQTALLEQHQDYTGAVLSSFGTNGQLTLGRAAASGTQQTGSITFVDGTSAANNYADTLNVQATLTGSHTISLPDSSGTICLTSQNCSTAGSGYILSQSSSLGTPQTGANFNIAGTGIAATALETPTLDTATGVALNIGNTHATSIALGNTTSNIATTINGTAVVEPTSGHDTTTAFQVVQNSSGNDVLDVDTSNARVGIGTNAPDQALNLSNGNEEIDYGDLGLVGIAEPTSAPSVAVGSSGALTGAYYYCVVFQTLSGHTACGPVSAVVNPSSQQVSVTTIPTGPTGVVARRLYRTKANETTTYYSVTLINDNTTTNFTDNISDAGLGATLSAYNTTSYISNPQGETVSEAFGLNATVTAANATAIGEDALAEGQYATVIGTSATGTAAGAAALGVTSTAGLYSTALGNAAQALNTDGVALGSGAHANSNFSIALGSGATATASYQLVVGSSTANSAFIQNAYFGSGVTDATPQNFTLNATGGSGSNIGGASLSVAGGIGTGTGNGGNINFETAKPSGSSSSTPNSLATVESLSGVNGAATFENSANSTTAFQIQNATGVPELTVDTSGNNTTLGHIGTSNALQGALVLSDGSTDNFGATVQTTGSLTGSSTFQLSVTGANGTYQLCTTLSVCSGYSGGSGTSIVEAPTTTAQNTINPGATSGVVALTVRGGSAGSPDILDVMDSGNTKQDFFSSTGSLNVAQLIQPTTNNAIDLGLSGTAFRTGYFGTSVVSPSYTGAGAVSLTSGGANTLTLDTGGAAALNIGAVSAATNAINLNQSTTVASGKNLTLTSGNYTQTSAATTGDAHSITDTGLTTGTALKVTSTSNSAANTSWSAIQFNPTNAQGTTAVSGTNLISGFDEEFTQAATVAGNNETVANFAIAANSGSPADSTVNSIINLANNDTATGNQITATNGLLVNGANVTNGIDFNGTFGTDLINTSTGNFSVSQAGAIVGVGVNSGTGLLQGTGGMTITGTTQINATTAGTTTIGNTTAGAVQLASGGASSFNVTGSTLALGGTNFNLATTGIVSLLGGTANDLTTAAGAAANGLIFQPGNSTTATSTGAGMTIQGGNDSGATAATGGLLTLKGGNASTGTTTTGGGVTIDSGSGTTAGGAVTIGGSNAASLALGRTGITTQVNGTAQVGGSAGTGALLNNGSTVNTAYAMANLTSGGWDAGGAAATVDKYTYISANQTTTGQTLVIPSPTASTTYGRLLFLSNIGTASFTLLTTTIGPGSTATLVWTHANGGDTWTFAGADGSGILNQNTADQTANFRITGTGRANTSFITPLVDSITGGLNIGTTTATGITIGGAATTGTIAIGSAAASTLNIGTGAFAHTIAIGTDTTTVQGITIGSSNSTSGTTLVAGSGNINLDASTLTTNAATLNMFNTTATTVNELQAATAINMGAANAVLAMGNGTGTGTLQVQSATATNQAGYNLTVAAGAANGSTTGGIGGDLLLNGGAAAGTGNNNGGGITLTGGVATGTGTGGTVAINGGAASATSGSAGGAVTINGANGTSTSTGGAGGNITLTAGNGTSTGNNNGGSVSFVAGNATGSGTPGIVSIDSPVFTSVTEAASGATYALTQSHIDGYGTIVVTESTANGTVTVAAPGNTAAGHVIYIVASNTSTAFTLSPAGGPSVNMNPDDTEMLVWNGNQWTASVSGSSLQQVYNNTSTAPASILTTSTTKTLLFQAGTGDDASNLLSVDNSFGSAALNVDSTQGVNLIMNSSIEANPLPSSGAGNWVKVGNASASVSRSTAQAYIGSASLAIAATVNSGDGAKQSLTNNAGTATALTASTQYYISWYANGAGTAVTNTIAEYSYNGSSFSACTGLNITSGVIPSATGWTRYTCTFTTGSGGTAPTTSNAVEIIQNAAQGATHTFYIDGVQLEQNSTSATAYRESAVQINSLLTSPLAIQTPSNSVSAFSVQNATGSSVLAADTLDNAVGINMGVQAFVAGGGDIQLGGSANRSIQVESAVAANAVGGNLTLAAGAANGTSTGNTGGSLLLNGGAAAGTGNNAGGGVTITGGVATGTGTGGTIALAGGAASATSGSAGGSVTINGANGTSTSTGGAGGAITLTAGNGTSTGNNAGGNISFVAGNATGSGTPGVVSIDSPVFTSVTEAASGATYALTQSHIDGYGTIVVTESTANGTVTVAAPGNTSAGHVIYIVASNGSTAFTLSPAGGPVVNMNPDDTEMLVWNGSQWTASVSGSSLQQVYNNTSTAPASIVTTSTTKTISIQAGTGDDATNLLGVQNAAGSSLLNVDSLDGAVGINMGSQAMVSGGGDLQFGGAAARTIKVESATAVNTAGASLTIAAGSAQTSSTGAAGGALNLDGGSAGGSNANAGGAVALLGGTASGAGAGGAITLQGGAAAAVAGSVGGAVTLTAGNGTTTGTGAAGGQVTINGGDAGGTNNNAGGNILLQAGNATGTGGPGKTIVEAGQNTATAFQIQNASAAAIVNVDTTTGNGCAEIGLQATATSGSYATCVGQSNGNGTLIVNSGSQYYSGLAFAQLNSTDVNTTNTTNYSQLLGIDANGNVGISNAAVSLTSPALAYWDGKNDPTQVPVTGQNGYAYPTPTATGAATFVSSALGERLTTTTGGTTGSLNWSFAQVPFEEVQFQFQSGGGNGADATWFYSYANAVPTTEYGTGMSNGYIVYFDEYWDCIGITYGTFTDSHQCNSAGGAGNPLAVYAFSNGNGGTTHYANDAIDDGNWHNVDIQFFYNQIIVRWDGQVVIQYADSYGRNLSYQDFGFGSRNGSQYNNHYIKGLLVTKLGTNTSQYDVNNVAAPLASNLYWDNSYNSGLTVMNQGALGVGTADPNATLEVDGTSQFDTLVTTAGTVCLASTYSCSSTTAGNEVLGNGTAFNAAMVGDKITFQSGYSSTIATVVNTTELTISGSELEDSNNTAPGVAYSIYAPVASVSGTILQVGSNSTTSGTNTLLGLGSYGTYADSATCSTSVDQGAMYYNTSTNAIRGCVNGGWEDLVTTSGLGLIAFGVIPDSSNAGTPGDLVGESGVTNSPCKVTWASATSVAVSACDYYSQGRKQIYAGSTLTGLTGTQFYHVCFSSTTSTAPVATAGTETGGFTGALAFSANNPVLCIADVQMASSVMTHIYDTRVFTTSVKSFATVAAAAPLGTIVKQSSTAAGQAVQTTTATDFGIMGVVVATSGVSSTTSPNAVIATDGAVYVKTNGTSTFDQFITPSTTAGYSTSNTALSTGGYGNLGIAQITVAGTCTTQSTAASDCQDSQFVQLSVK